jgi:hypothetical protein
LLFEKASINSSDPPQAVKQNPCNPDNPNKEPDLTLHSDWNTSELPAPRTLLPNISSFPTVVQQIHLRKEAIRCLVKAGGGRLEGVLTTVLNEEVRFAHQAQLARRPFINQGRRFLARGGPDPAIGLRTPRAHWIVRHRRPIGAGDRKRGGKVRTLCQHRGDRASE